MEIVVRNTRSDDFRQVIDISERVYPEDPWTREELESHLRVFPGGQFVAVTAGEGAVVGLASSLILRWDDYDFDEDWRDYTGGGTFANHDPEGRTLYGAEVMVRPEWRRRGVGSALYDRRERLVRELDLLRIRAHARLVGYRRLADEMSAREYVDAVMSGRIDDPTLSFQLDRGFEVLAVVADYLPDDPKSRGWAALIEWKARGGTGGSSRPGRLRFP